MQGMGSPASRALPGAIPYVGGMPLSWGVHGVWEALTPVMKRINMHCLLMEGCIYRCTGPQVAVRWLPDGN